MAKPRVINALNKPYPVTVEVHFDQSMLNDGALTDPDNYAFSHGAFATEVQILDDKQVMLVVENLFDYDSFSVTVSANVKNLSGEGIDPLYSTKSFGIIRPTVPDFALTITATNGRLKSGVNVLALDEDAESWYLMTESGVDIVNKVSLANAAFILDAYGYTAISISKD